MTYFLFAIQGMHLAQDKARLWEDKQTERVASAMYANGRCWL